MFKNYLLTAWRNIKRNKLYTVINIFGLSVGITGAVLIILFLSHELSFDSHHEQHDNIYRLEGAYTIAGNRNHLAITPFPLGPAMKEEFSSVKEYVRFFAQEEILVNVDDRKFLEDQMAYVDSTVFEVFTFRFIHGSPHGALSEPNSVVLTYSLSEKYFGETVPLGEIIKINHSNYKITGVIEDIPSSSHIQYRALLSMSTLNHEAVYSLSPNLFWSINTNYTYLLMHPEADLADVFSNLTAFHEKYTLPVGNMIGGESEFTYTPLREVRFSNITFSQGSASKTTLLVLIIVAIFLIVIAAVNYTNLATARASVRAREIGVRKVSGATRLQIFSQFLSESLLLAFVSLFFSLLLIEFFLPGFNHLAGKAFRLMDLFQWPFVFYVILVVAFTGMLAGLYPAVFISKMSPSEIMKGSKGSKAGSALLRKGLVVFQFAISIMLISGTFMVNRQLQYLQNKDLGLETRDRAVVRLQSAEVRQKAETLESMLLQNPDILSVAKAASVPGRGFNKHAVQVQAKNEVAEATITGNYIDYRFLDLFDIPLVEGRGFEKDLRADAMTSVIVNQTAVNYFGWQDDPLAGQIHWQFNQEGVPQVSFRVVGVVEDHNLLNLHHAVEPVMYILPEDNDPFLHMIVHYSAGKETEVMAFLERTMMEFDPDNFPNISKVDRGYREQFEAEERLGTIFAVFAFVCIIMSFMGLFGLSSFLTEQRSREIGVRKVLGSSVWDILKIFYKEFSLLVIVASLITLPLSWYLLSRWLQGFTYQTAMQADPFVWASVLALTVAVVTVSFHTFRAATLNPVEALKSE